MNFAELYQQYGPMGEGRGGSWLGAIFGLLFFLVIVGGVIYAIRTFSTSHHWGPTAPRDPLDIAKERYAKGEITKEELAEIKKELK
jgi:putative membrane protein